MSMLLSRERTLSINRDRIGGLPGLAFSLAGTSPRFVLFRVCAHRLLFSLFGVHHCATSVSSDAVCPGGPLVRAAVVVMLMSKRLYGFCFSPTLCFAILRDWQYLRTHSLLKKIIKKVLIKVFVPRATPLNKDKNILLICLLFSTLTYFTIFAASAFMQFAATFKTKHFYSF